MYTLTARADSGPFSTALLPVLLSASSPSTMGMTKEMAKFNRKVAKGEEKQRCEERNAAMAALCLKDQQILLAHEADEKAQEQRIQEEIDKEFQDYLMNGEPVFIASRSKQQLAVLQEKKKMELKRASELPKLLSNSGAKKLVNEDSLAIKEKYTIQRKDIGKGTYGFVYRAEDPDKRQIAVKVTTLKSLPQEYRFRLTAGFNTLRYLKEHPHPNIVSLVEIFESPEKTYIFMEYYEIDLFQRIRKEAPFKEKDGIGIAIQIAEGVKYLHSIGVAHENLKPHHILFKSANGHSPAVITGFGWSVVAFDLEKGSVNMQKGSRKQKFHHDFPPEKMTDDLYDPIAADVWAFGALLVQLMTQEHPYEPKSPHRIDIQWKLAFKKAGVKLSDKVHDALEVCFRMDPSTRGTMVDVLSKLKA